MLIDGGRNFTQMHDQQAEKPQVIFIGPCGTGKSQIINYFLGEPFEVTPWQPMSGSCFVQGKGPLIDCAECVVCVWDTPGQERMFPVLKINIEYCGGVVLVFDITNRQSFANIQYRMTAMCEFRRLDQCVILVGNKLDLAGQRAVSTEEAEEFAKMHNADYFEVSAKTGANVDAMFDRLVLRTLHRT